METYENSFFRPKPNDRKKCCHELDEPCKLNAFACTKTWWETNIKKYIKMAEDEYKNKIEIDIDEFDDKHTVDVRVDGKYVATAKSKEELAVILKSIYSMLTTMAD